VLPRPKNDDDISGRFAIGRANLAEGSAEVAATRFKEVMDNHRPTLSMDSALAPSSMVARWSSSDGPMKHEKRTNSSSTTGSPPIPGCRS
jgi:hypothetical protein